MNSILSQDTYMMFAAATKKAIRDAGGPTAVAENLGGIPRQNVERWYAMPSNGSGERFIPRSIPLFRIVEIEADVVSSGGLPPITRAIASYHGFDLLRRTDKTSAGNPVLAIGHLMKEAGAACETVTDAVADGVITADEKQKCISDLQKVIEAASQALGSLAGADCDAD
ncbi:phage regulatory CII family protein [Roseibium alexandrii]|uniref:phage regulatory CII family protein n=1 Tax=Roseibium alexandrii TaxID=388408 RepID=UPI003750D23F